MTKSLKWIIGGVLLIGIILIIYFAVTKEEKYFDRITLPQVTMVVNKTQMNYLDTIIQVGLYELGESPTVIVIEELTDKNKPKNDLQELDLDAYIYGINGQYILAIRPMDRSRALMVISHELIHLQQTQQGRLFNGKDKLIFEDVIYLKNEAPTYINRPWEVEAYKKQYSLRDRIKERLYSKQ